MSDIIRKELVRFKQLMRKWLYVENDSILEVALGSYVANVMVGDPVWTVIIAPPSSTKTEIMNMFQGYKYTFTLSSLTENTLISGQKRKRESDPEPSLIFHLSGKILILKDFTSILSMRDQCVRSVVAQLREIYDGYLEKGFGTGKLIRWHGKMGLLAACTPAYDAHYSIIGPLGDRFLLYRDSVVNGTKMAAKAMQCEGCESEMRQELRQKCHHFLDLALERAAGDDINVPHIIKKKLVALSEYAASARTLVFRNSYTRELEAFAEPEGPARLTKNLVKLGKALAIVQGRSEIRTPVYLVLKKVGRDLVPRLRHKVLYAMWRNCINRDRFDYLSINTIVEYSGVPKTTARTILNDLHLLGMVEFQEAKTRHHYKLSERIFRLMEQSEVFI